MGVLWLAKVKWRPIILDFRNMAESREAQRGSRNCEIMSGNSNLQFDSSDDEAPEEVNFEDAKNSALQSVKDALEASRR